MADLAATDVTVTLTPGDRYFLPVPLTIVFASITFGDASKTYPSGGIPLPELGKLGLHKTILRFFVQDPGSGYVYSYDAVNHKLKIFQGAVGALTEYSGAPAEVTLNLMLYGA